MANTTQATVRTVLREGGPLTLDEIVTRVMALSLISTRDPKKTVGNVITGDPLCVSSGDGRYVYLPAFMRHARMRVPMDLAVPDKGLIVVGTDVHALLWSTTLWAEPDITPVLALAGGPEVTLEGESMVLPGGVRAVLQLPAAFWEWWEERRRRGADALLLTCEDAEAGRFTLDGLRTAMLDEDAVAARNGRLREVTAAVVKRTAAGLRVEDVARRLLAQGVYHGDPPPEPLLTLLFDPSGPFSVENDRVIFRPELTPALRRLFAHRRAREQHWDTLLVHEVLERQPPPEPAPPADAPPSPLPPAERGFRLKVRLQWDRRIWRVIAMLDDQTLEDLHYAIQDAFGWDNDHLYAFFLSGRAWDSMTEVSGPFGGDVEPPTTDEVILADLELRPGQKVLYIFDFGDDLRHEIEVVGSFPLPANGPFPRIVESHGEAPPQYPEWNDEEDGDVEGE
jgi:hypothetical protein